MRESPRIRRLRTDLHALERLKAESSILDYSTVPNSSRAPPETYLVRFLGNGLWRPDSSSDVVVRKHHAIRIQLGAAYPRMMPELHWETPIFHPNISASGVVCLGGYGTHWVPSLNLDELCVMLWDMIRYANFDVESPYNREAAAWAKNQQTYHLPIDPRPLRDRLASVTPPDPEEKPPIKTKPQPLPTAEVVFIDNEEIVDAEIVEPEDPGILFIE